MTCRCLEVEALEAPANNETAHCTRDTPAGRGPRAMTQRYGGCARTTYCFLRRRGQETEAKGGWNVRLLKFEYTHPKACCLEAKRPEADLWPLGLAELCGQADQLRLLGHGAACRFGLWDVQMMFWAIQGEFEGWLTTIV